MPTANSFTALGRGNGFPFCLTKRDVTALNDQWHWTTLSGVNADNYTSYSGSSLQEKVDQSLAHAMKLYWTRYKATGFSASTTGDLDYRSSINQPTSGQQYSWDESLSAFTDDDASSIRQPSARSCEGYPYDGLSKVYTPETDYSADFSEVGHRLEAGMLPPTISAFYDGDTLLGYGLERNQDSDAVESGFGAMYSISRDTFEGIGDEARAIVSVGNLLYDDSPSHQDSWGHERSFEYVTISGMHFVEFKEGYVPTYESPNDEFFSGQVNTISITLSTGSVSVSRNFAWYYNNPDYGILWTDASRTADVSRCSSIDFYTF